MQDPFGPELQREDVHPAHAIGGTVRLIDTVTEPDSGCTWLSRRDALTHRPELCGRLYRKAAVLKLGLMRLLDGLPANDSPSVHRSTALRPSLRFQRSVGREQHAYYAWAGAS